MTTHNMYQVMKRTPDARSTTGMTLNAFPFGTTREEIAKAGNENVESLAIGTQSNPLFHRWFEQMKSSGLYSEELLSKGDAAPLGQVQAQVIDAATPYLVGRQIDTILRTDDIKVRLYQRRPGIGHRIQAGGRAAVLGARYKTTDI